MASLSEEARDAIIAELGDISVANGYRTTPNQVIASIRNPDRVTTCPEIGVELGMERTVPLDNACTAWDSYIDVHIAGTVSGDMDTDYEIDNLNDAAEALLHDIRRIVAGLWIQWLTGGDLRWNVATPRQFECYRILNLNEKRTKGRVGLVFQIRIRNQNDQFQATEVSEIVNIGNEQGGMLLEEDGNNLNIEQVL